MKYFFDFKEIGSLTLDKIFFESNYPILFTCINSRNEVFLCVCSQNDLNKTKWLITKVEIETIIKLLSNKISIKNAFLNDKSDKYTIMIVNNQKNIIKNDFKSWKSDTNIDLPNVEEFLDADNEEYLYEIKYFNKFLNDLNK